MLIDNENASNFLSEEEERTLLALLNLIISPSDDGRMPGAAEVGFIQYIAKENMLLWIKEGLVSIIDECHRSIGDSLSSLSICEQKEFIEKIKRRHFRFFGDLTAQVMQCYYQDEKVLAAIGLETRSPFPLGFSVEDGDLGLLESVYERGKIYRDL